MILSTTGDEEALSFRHSSGGHYHACWQHCSGNCLNNREGQRGHSSANTAEIAQEEGTKVNERRSSPEPLMGYLGRVQNRFVASGKDILRRRSRRSGMRRLTNPQNLLLTMLPPLSRRRLFAELELVPLQKGDVISSHGAASDHIYFLNAGVCALQLPAEDERFITVGMIGNEGLAPLSSFKFSAFSPFDIVVNFPGTAFRLPAGIFNEIKDRDKIVADVVQQFSHVLMLQISHTSLTNAVNSVEVRLGRWLLMLQDRLWGNRIETTHSFLGSFMGVRRASVTTALHSLEGMHLIRSNRAVVEIRDRQALKAFVGNSYGQPEREYAELVKDMMPEFSETEEIGLPG